MKKHVVDPKFITLERLFQSIPMAVALVGRGGRYIALNDALANIAGVGVSDLVGAKVSDVSKESGENSKRDFEYFDADKEVADHELRINDSTYLVSVRPVRDNDECVIGEIVALADITKHKEVEQKLLEANKKLKHLANFDPLTNVLNARTYYQVCDSVITILKRKSKDFSVLFIDLDHFKKINDTYGHHAGDCVLQSVAETLRDETRSCDVVGRVGGEEFSVFLPESGLENAMATANKIRKKIEQKEIVCNNKTINITASIGVAPKMKHHNSISDIQRDADHAMYHAKKEGRNRISYLNKPCYIEE